MEEVDMVTFHMNDFFDKKFIKGLTEEVKSLPFSDKINDLHYFKQTEDFHDLHLPALCSEFVMVLKTKIKAIAQDKFGIPLGKTTVTASAYHKRDFLLCHDDQVGDRAVAFIYYLTEYWTEDDGGRLNFFAHDPVTQYPQNGVYLQRILPEHNKMVLFKVSSKSHHEVEQVYGEKIRWSINGWFHRGTPPTIPINNNCSSDIHADNTGDFITKPALLVDKLLDKPVVCCCEKFLSKKYDESYSYDPSKYSMINTREEELAMWQCLLYNIAEKTAHLERGTANKPKHTDRLKLKWFTQPSMRSYEGSEVVEVGSEKSSIDAQVEPDSTVREFLRADVFWLKITPSDTEEVYNVYENINQQYTSPRGIASLKEYFQGRNVAPCSNFLKAPFCRLLEDELMRQCNWENVGPPNRRNYNRMSVRQEKGYLTIGSSDVPDSAMYNTRQLLRMLTSYDWLDFLQKITGSEFATNEEGKYPIVVEVMRWTGGCYNLIADNDFIQNLPGIEVSFFFGVNKEKLAEEAETLRHSGQIGYVVSQQGAMNENSFKKLTHLKLTRTFKLLQKRKARRLSEALKQKKRDSKRTVLTKQEIQEVKKKMGLQEVPRPRQKSIGIFLNDQEVQKAISIVSKKMDEIINYRNATKQYLEECTEVSNYVPQSSDMVLSVNSKLNQKFTHFITANDHEDLKNVCYHSITATYIIKSPLTN